MNSTWKTSNNVLEKKFVFKNFKEALAFVNKVGESAEQYNHHPDIAIQNYKEVVVRTTTHSEGNTITEKDHELAFAIDGLSENREP
jgi:4a-hydroxytetrahydrobiopterin dehydratase